MKFPNLFPKYDLPRKYEPRTNMGEIGIIIIFACLWAALIALPVNLALWGWYGLAIS
jgi:hypothetical protein